MEPLSVDDLSFAHREPVIIAPLPDAGLLAVGLEKRAAENEMGAVSGAGQVVVAAGSAVFGPSARLEMPAAEGPNNDMDASR